jgi:3-oxoadipate enol-lactonase
MARTVDGIATVNGIELNYRLEGDGAETIVLINGLADDLESWVLQVDDFLAAGYRVLRFDNRGVGASSAPAGPYSSAMLAADAKALVDSLGVRDFHLMGVSMGGMIAQEYALSYPADVRSVTFACTYAAPGPFCSRMFAMWADMAPVLGVPFVMRDVTLWAFTVPFFEQRGTELAEFETAMRYMAQPVHAYLAQLAVITEHDTTSRLGQITVPTLVLAGEEDILIPVSLSRRIHDAIPGSDWATTKGGHACCWEHPAEFNKAFLDFVRRHGKG